MGFWKHVLAYTCGSIAAMVVVSATGALVLAVAGKPVTLFNGKNPPVGTPSYVSPPPNPAVR